MLAIGELAPDFRVVDDEGRPFTLKDALVGGPFVIFFYPADFTPICTKEACMFRDHHPDLDAAGVQVFGVSPQGANSKAAFRREHNLPYRLLADPDKSMAKAWDATGVLNRTVRVTYAVDAEGRIIDRVKADLQVNPHEAFVRRVSMRLDRSKPEQ